MLAVAIIVFTAGTALGPLEAYSPNRGHLYEKTIFEITKGFPWLSSESNTWKEFKYAD